MNAESISEQLPEEQLFEWPRQAERENDWKGAAKRWDILLNSYPTSATIVIGLIQAHIRAKDVQAAVTIFKNAGDVLKENAAYYQLQAQILLLESKSDKALEIMAIAREKYPNDIQTWLQSSDYALQKGDLSLAEQLNTEARQRFPNRFGLLKQYADLAMYSEDWHVALDRWSDFRRNFPEYPTGFNQAAIAAEKMGDYVLARKLRLAREYGETLLEPQTDSISDKNIVSKRHRHNTLSGLAELVWIKSIFNLRSETERSYLSYIWWVLEPLLYVVVFYFVFGHLLQRGGEGFTTFLLTGLIPWMWFNKSIINSSNSIIAGKGLLLNVGIPPLFFPLVMIVQSTLKQIPVFIILFAFAWLLGSEPTLNWFNLLPIMFVQFLMTIWVGSLLAALVPFIRDISYLVPTGLTFLMFLSGVFFNYQQLPSEWHSLFLMNPLAFLLKCYRDIFLYNAQPELLGLIFWVVMSGLGCLMSFWLYQKLRYVFPKVVVS